MKTNLLIILDGWGYRPNQEHNAIAQAKTPHWDNFLAKHPNRLIDTFGISVGLPSGQMGNSEVGHMNLGSGRVIYQNLTKIDLAIKTGDFNQNQALTTLLTTLKSNGKKLHLMGLLSDGGIHSHINHIKAACTLASNFGIEVRLHAFLDGRDTAPQCAERFLNDMETHFKTLPSICKIASVSGRYYAMDRDNRWDRVEKAYHAIVAQASVRQASSALDALKESYARQEKDEFVEPTVIQGYTGIEEQDAILFMNFRADRARELSQAFTDSDFSDFPTLHPSLSHFGTLTQFSSSKSKLLQCLFPPEAIKNTMAEYLSNLEKKQLHIAETEKYAHVTFFFNGGVEEPYPNETRILINSPKVATYDLKPEMSAEEVTDKLVEAIKNQTFDFIVCNYANGDMVGHTGIMEAAIKAIETLDTCLGRIGEALAQHGGQALITADHGNAELMWDDEKQEVVTSHTVGPVYLVYLGNQAIAFKQEEGALSNVIPTMLKLMNLPIPSEMDKPLI